MECSLISILMPVYNASKYLRESVDSVLSQTLNNFEFLIIDDGSTDDSVAIIKSYHDKRIRLILNNHDFINSLNIGIYEAKGKYIVRMDADDIMLSHRLQYQVEFMEQYPEIGVCGSFAEYFGTEEIGLMQVETQHERLIASLLLHNSIIHPSVIIRRSVMEKNQYKEGYPCAEDYKLWTDLALQGIRFANIPEVLLRYRNSPNQVTQTQRDKMIDSTFKIRMEYAERVMEQIVEKDERYTDFLNQLIELTNGDLIKAFNFQNILYSVYSDFLN